MWTQKILFKAKLLIKNISKFLILTVYIPHFNAPYHKTVTKVTLD